MYKVHNQKAIRNIVIKSFFANKTRNIVAVIAIALTALLFTSVATIGFTIVGTLQDSYMRQVGTTLHGGYKFITQDFYEMVEKDNEVSNIAYRIIIGGLKNEELSKIHTEISYVDENYAKTSYMYPEIGNMPQAKNQVVIADSILKALNVPLEIGAEITLKFRANGIDYEDNFVVSGIYEVDPALAVSQIITSHEYALEVAPVWVGNDVLYYMEKMSEDNSFVAGSIMTNFNFRSSFDIESQMEELNTRMGFDMNLVDDGVNWAYLASDIDVMSVILVAVLVVIITSSGYLIIYNIFLISVSNDIKFYGLLKTIGTTSKQLKKILRLQALILSVIGIPIGLALGYYVGVSLMPTIMEMSTFDDFVASINPWIFIFATIFSLITVQISCDKPCKFISKLSPIEAVRHTNIDKKVKNIRKTKKVTAISMALANIKRNKLKTVLVVISISLSALIFNITYTFVNGLDMDDYLARFVVSDFLVTNSAVLNLGQDRVLDGVTDEFINEISAIDGVLEIGKTYVYPSTHTLSKTAKENVEFSLENYANKESMWLEGVLLDLEESLLESFIYGVSENLMDKLITENNDIIGKDYLTKEQIELFKTGNYVLTTGYYTVSRPDELFYNIGETVLIDFGNGNTKEYEVLDAGDLPYSLDKRYNLPLDVYFILPESEFLKQIPNRKPLNVTVWANEEDVPQIEQYIFDYTNNVDTLLDYESKALYMKAFEGLKNTYLATGYTLSFILGFIGVVNFINTMITSVSSRKLELAMLQSLGLTGKQMKTMLISEGLFYALSVMAFLSTIGSFITYHIVDMLSVSMIASNYNFEVLPFVIISILLGIISIVVPLIIYNNIKGKSIVERLREIG